MRAYYTTTPRGVAVLGRDPYARGVAILVGALHDTPRPGECAHERGDRHAPAPAPAPAPCDLPHEGWVVMENRNGFSPFPAFWCRGDCGAAYTGWAGRVPSVEVPDGASRGEVLLAVLRAAVEDIERNK